MFLFNVHCPSGFQFSPSFVDTVKRRSRDMLAVSALIVSRGVHALAPVVLAFDHGFGKIISSLQLQAPIPSPAL